MHVVSRFAEKGKQIARLLASCLPDGVGPNGVVRPALALLLPADGREKVVDLLDPAAGLSVE
jgi:hypothetical protein